MPVRTFMFDRRKKCGACLAGNCPTRCPRTVEIAERCDLKLPENINHLPNFSIPEGAAASADEYFERL